MWDKVFKSGLSKFCGRQPIKNFEGIWSAKHVNRNNLLMGLYWTSSFAKSSSMLIKEKLIWFLCVPYVLCKCWWYIHRWHLLYLLNSQKCVQYISCLWEIKILSESPHALYFHNVAALIYCSFSIDTTYLSRRK